MSKYLRAYLINSIKLSLLYTVRGSCSRCFDSPVCTKLVVDSVRRKHFGIFKLVNYSVFLSVIQIFGESTRHSVSYGHLNLNFLQRPGRMANQCHLWISGLAEMLHDVVTHKERLESYSQYKSPKACVLLLGTVVLSTAASAAPLACIACAIIR